MLRKQHSLLILLKVARKKYSATSSAVCHRKRPQGSFFGAFFMQMIFKGGGFIVAESDDGFSERDGMNQPNFSAAI